MERDSTYQGLFEIQATSSRDASREPEFDDINKFEKTKDVKWIEDLTKVNQPTPEYLRIKFRDRPISDMILRSIYLILRCVYVTVWFYFLPYLAMVYQFYNSHWSDV